MTRSSTKKLFVLWKLTSVVRWLLPSLPNKSEVTYMAVTLNETILLVWKMAPFTELVP
jgi:hypothetical protein